MLIELSRQIQFFLTHCFILRVDLLNFANILISISLTSFIVTGMSGFLTEKKCRFSRSWVNHTPKTTKMFSQYQLRSWYCHIHRWHGCDINFLDEVFSIIIYFLLVFLSSYLSCFYLHLQSWFTDRLWATWKVHTDE